MEFFKYLALDPTFIFLILFVIFAASIIYNVRRNNENLNNNNSEDTVVIHDEIFQEIDIKEIDKVEENTHQEEEIIVNETLSNLMDDDENSYVFEDMVGDKIDQEYIDKGLMPETMNDKGSSEELISELSPEKAPLIQKFIKRIDDDGKLILPFEALDFISKKHKPLVMPDGTLRVLNLIEIEEEILLSIKENKTLFCINKKDNKVEKITSEVVKKHLLDSDEHFIIEEYYTLKDELKKQIEINKDLYLNMTEIESEHYETLENQKVLLRSLDSITSSKKEASLEEVQLAKEIAKKTEKDAEIQSKKIEDNRKENASQGGYNELKQKLEKAKKPRKSTQGKKATVAEEIIKQSDDVEQNIEDVKENIVVADDAGADSKNEIITTPKEVKTKTEEEIVIELKDEPIIKKEPTPMPVSTSKTEIKKLSKKDLKAISKELYSEEFLLSDEELSCSSGLDVQTVISSKTTSEETTLYLNKQTFILMIERVLEKLYGSYDKSPQIVATWFDFEEIVDNYFSYTNNGTKLFKAILYKAVLNSDLMYGSKVAKKYSIPFSKNDLNDDICISEGKRKIVFEDLLNLLERDRIDKV